MNTMQRDDINPHAFDEHKLNHESKQKAVDRLLEFESDVRQRVDTLVKSIFVLSGGALTISIGIFLRSEAPQLSPHLVGLLQMSWGLLFYSLAASAAVLFIMIMQGYQFAFTWQQAFNKRDSTIEPGRFQKVCRTINWVLGITGFGGFLAGLALLAYVSVTAIAP